MRDYMSYFANKGPKDKRGVSIKKDIDWWMGYCASRMAKLLFLFLLAAIFLVVKFFLQVGKSQSLFPVDRITLTGDVLITQPEDIQKTLALVGNTSFFNINIQKVTEEIEKLPWIEKSTITRQWPDSLTINIEERKAKYRWGKTELLDAEGNRFANIDVDTFLHLPQLGGVDGHESEVIFAYEQLVSELGSRINDLESSSFILNRYLSWELHLQSGLVIKFGRDNFERRLGLFVDAYQQRKLPSFAQIDSIDLRYQRGFSVKWKPDFAPTAFSGGMVKVSAKQI